jgi:nucleotide-binding universal stress UspA family protein
MINNLYLVPHDFTEVGEAALKYAIHLAQHVNAEIRLLHLTASTSDSIRANDKLDKIIANIHVKAGITITKTVKQGSIFEDIGKISKSEGAQLVIMGTHGPTGLQKIFGSNAMKVITSAETPFLVVQKETPLNEIKNIVVPIDLSKESLQIVNIAGDMARIYGAKVHVIGEKQNDALLGQQMKNRISIIQKQYEDRDVACSVDYLSSSGTYQKKIMQFTKDNGIDLIAIAYHSESLLPQFDTFAQSLITNDQKLPCMVLNSKLASALYF